MVILGVKNQEDLSTWEDKLSGRDILFETFVEPDLRNERTALAVIPIEDGRIFKKLKLLRGDNDY